MKSVPKYSWLIYQKNPKKIDAIMKKNFNRGYLIIELIKSLKKNNLPICNEFIKDQLHHYLLSKYRWGIYCACFRNLKGIHPLVSEDVYNTITFDKFIKSKHEGVYYTQEFYKLCCLTPTNKDTQNS